MEVSSLVSAKRLFKVKKDVDMTEGSIVKHLVVFAVPLLLGNVLQLMYNTVDSWVVGNFVSKEAFSAVGTVSPIINFLISFFLGFSAGAGVVISQFYGAKKYDEVKRSVHTVLISTVIIGLVITIIGILFVPLMLTLINVPEDVRGEAEQYLTVYFSGILGLVLYNIGSGILRAVGDSRRPFIFLAVSAVTNTILDLLFVLKFEMGVFGVALATILAQFFSAVLIIITLIRSDSCIKLGFNALKIDREIFFKILKLGLPTALQLAITSFSNIFVQSYINYFDTSAMGGWTAYGKIDQLVLLPMQSVSLAATTFVGQNLGKNDVKRAKRGVNTSIALAIGSTVILMIPVLIFAPELVWFFNKDESVIGFGVMFLRWLTPFYVLCCLNQIYAGVLRGSGNTTAPMFITLASFVAFRQAYLYVMKNYISNNVIAIAMGYPAGWLVCSILMFVYYKTTKLEKGRIVK